MWWWDRAKWKSNDLLLPDLMVPTCFLLIIRNYLILLWLFQCIHWLNKYTEEMTFSIQRSHPLSYWHHKPWVKQTGTNLQSSLPWRATFLISLLSACKLLHRWAIRCVECILLGGISKFKFPWAWWSWFDTYGSHYLQTMPFSVALMALSTLREVTEVNNVISSALQILKFRRLIRLIISLLWFISYM